MAPLNETELSAIRERHERAVLDGTATVRNASAAHDDRERLLDAVERMLPVCDAARVVEGLIQRGPLPAAARSALLELHVALVGLAKAGHRELDADCMDEEADDASEGDVRLSA